MRIVFMGTPDFAAHILEELIGVHEVVGVYTRADAVRGRSKALVPSPVKRVAASAGIPVFSPKSLRKPEEVERLASLSCDVVCVAAYGLILPQDILDVPRLGCLNVHASLLPKYRGAAPIERAILAGEREAGVCIMRMEAGLDTGPYCVCRSVEIAGMSAARLTEELADKGARALISALYALERGQARWVEQDDEQATWAPKLAKGELNIAPDDACDINLRRVQASGEAHPSRCVVAGKGVTILDARAVAADDAVREHLGSCEAGHVAFVSKRLFFGCADGAFEILEIKPDGKKAMRAAAFASGVQNIKSGAIAWERI